MGLSSSSSLLYRCFMKSCFRDDDDDDDYDDHARGDGDDDGDGGDGGGGGGDNDVDERWVVGRCWLPRLLR